MSPFQHPTLRSLFLLCGGALVGCAQPETCSTDTADSGIQVGTIDASCRCNEPSFDFGTGDSSFVPVSDGDDVTMIHGPQGGWHIWGSVRVSNTRDVVKIGFTAVDIESQKTVVDVTNQVALAMENDCTGTYTGMYGFIDVEELAVEELDTPPELLCLHDLELTMTLTDSGGRHMVEKRRVRAMPDQADTDICTP